MGTSAPVYGIGLTGSIPGGTNGAARESSGQTVNYDVYGNLSSGNVIVDLTASGASGYPQIYADLNDATAATINQLREAFQIQRLYERDARGGTRYTEILKAHFGVTSPDARLQRPEYLGGGSSPVNVNPVAQTSSTDSTSPQGNLAAIGTFAAHGHGFIKSFTEHCVIIGLVSARADLTYQQGLNRMFSRRTRWDFYWPALAHLGEQAILNKEIYAQGTSADEDTFGYQERYAEYRYKPSQITGQFRSNFAQSLTPGICPRTSQPCLYSTRLSSKKTRPLTAWWRSLAIRLSLRQLLPAQAHASHAGLFRPRPHRSLLRYHHGMASNRRDRFFYSAGSLARQVRRNKTRPRFRWPANKWTFRGKCPTRLTSVRSRTSKLLA